MEDNVETILSVILSAFYGLLCLTSGIQTARILYYKHNLKSFHFGFLILVFFWTVLRVIFFSQTESTPILVTLLLFVLPVDVQFATFALLVLFYAYMVHKREWESKKRLITWAYIAVNTIVFGSSIVYCIVGSIEDEVSDTMERLEHYFNGGQFLLLVIVYAYYGYKLSKLQQVPYFGTQPDKGASAIIFITIFAGLLFLSRCVYDFLAALNVFNIEISNDDGGIKHVGWDAFSLLFIWEIVPTLMVLFYFRRIPSTDIHRGVNSCCARLCCLTPDNDNSFYPGSFSSSSGSPWDSSSSIGRRLAGGYDSLDDEIVGIDSPLYGDRYGLVGWNAHHPEQQGGGGQQYSDQSDGGHREADPYYQHVQQPYHPPPLDSGSNGYGPYGNHPYNPNNHHPRNDMQYNAHYPQPQPHMSSHARVKSERSSNISYDTDEEPY